LDLLFVGSLAFSVDLRLCAFMLTTTMVAAGGAVEVAPIAALFGLYRSLPFSLATIVLPYALFYSLREKRYYALLLLFPFVIALVDFANDLGMAISLGILG